MRESRFRDRIIARFRRSRSVKAAKGPVMQPYLNRNFDSGVFAFEIHEDSIDIAFKGNPKIYTYPASKIGTSNLKRMKILAIQGKGLGTFINQDPLVKNGYIIK